MEVNNNTNVSFSRFVMNVAQLAQFRGLEVHKLEEELKSTRHLLQQVNERVLLEQIQNKIREAVYPISLSIDSQLSENFRFLAWSLTFVNIHGVRQNMVFLERTTLLEFNLEYILNRVKSYFPVGKLDENIDLIMVANKEMLPTTSVKKQLANHHMLCTFTHISNFADEITKIQEFAKPIMTVKKVVDAVQNDAVIFADFERHIKSKNTDLPVYRNNDWLSDVKFLERYFELHETLTYVADVNDLEMINKEELHLLKYLLNILKLLKDMSNNLSQENSSISDVFANIAHMKRLLPSPAPAYFEERIGRIFDNKLSVLIGSISNRFSFSSLLDPRHAYQLSITTSNAWNSFERILRAELGKKLSETSPETFICGEVDREIEIYRKLLIESRPLSSDCPFYWWNSKKNIIPILYAKAVQFLTPTPTTIDVAHFFGSKGKYSKICELLEAEEVKKYLLAASWSESFVGRGFNSVLQRNDVLKSLPVFAAILPIESRKQNELALAPVDDNVENVENMPDLELARPTFQKEPSEKLQVEEVEQSAVSGTNTEKKDDPVPKKRRMRRLPPPDGRKPCLRSDSNRVQNTNPAGQTPSCRRGSRCRQSKKLFTM